MIQREVDSDFSPTKQDTKVSKAPSSSTTAPWSRLKDPRIVCVSRASGGKDRHSKVSTVRGLRDRRVRLSALTAIQLYDLQDRLGLNQPSKVVDWLLNAAKDEIDGLPPLQIPPLMNNNLHPMLMNNSNQEFIRDEEKLQGLMIDDDPLKETRSNVFWGKSKDISGGETSVGEHNQEFSLDQNQMVNFLSRQNPSSSMSSFLMNGSSIPTYGSFMRWDPSSLTLSHPPSQPEDSRNFTLVPLQSPLSSVQSSVLPHPPYHHEALVYQPTARMSTHSYFPSQFDLKNSNFQSHNSQVPHSSLSSPHVEEESNANQPVRPFHFSMSTAELFPSENKVNNGFRLG